MNIKVTGTQVVKIEVDHIDVDPIDVITTLLDYEINSNREFVLKEEDEYYLVRDEYRTETKTSISKDKYDYIKSLELILKYIKSNK